MKGIVLAGGSGTRLYPVTKGMNKQLLPIYDKPMVYYPISVLMLAGIRDILIISTPCDLSNFKRLLGDGSDFGVNFEYKEQFQPKGIAEAFLIGEDFIEDEDVCLVLGDNVFHGSCFSKILTDNLKYVLKSKQPVVFGYYVNDPERYGVMEFDENNKLISIDEKPKHPKSNYAVVGLYMYPNNVVDIVKSITPSERDELEITSVNQKYIERDEMSYQILNRGFAWLDTGTHDSMMEASNYIETIEKRQGLKIACLEEIAYNKGWITKEQVLKHAKKMPNNNYGQYLINMVNQ